MPNYDINYDDERFKNVEAEKQDQLNQVNDMYNNMIDQSDKFYQDQANAAKEYAEKQAQIQNENTQFTIDKINQQKEQAQKDYTKEQSGAYVDWRKQSNNYGANAEEMASKGLQNTGYSESSQVSMYNTYQNRVASAKQSFEQSKLNYDNAIKEAQLANNSTLADIAYKALQTQLELALQQFQYKNTLFESQLQQRQNVEDREYSKWKDVLDQLNYENELKENMRQYDLDMQYQKERDAVKDAQYKEQLEYQKERDRIADEQWQKEYNLSLASKYSNSSSSSYSSSSSSSKTYEVNTPYYQGKKNSDCQYGTFGAKDNNGQSYQPNNLGKDSNGNIKYLKSSGKTVGQMYGNGQVFGSTGADLSNQTVWKYGKNYYIWDGSQNQYIKVS